MEEAKLLTLIAQGETEDVDFKRELNLQQAKGKAELIKDIIAIANSVKEVGYLIIGVNDDKTIIGIDKLEEERIQQIVHTYVSPNIILKCNTVTVSKSPSLKIGTLEIKGTEKPHRVTRAIEQLKQNQVFVRRGTTTAEASPEELFRMREMASELDREIRQYARAAERHFSLGNADQALKAYSRAIELNPVPELFIARGNVYRLYVEPGFGSYLDEEKAKLAYKDFSDALALAESIELIKAARLGRLRICSVDGYYSEFCKEDFEWLNSNTENHERGEVLYLKEKALYVGEQGDKMTLHALNEAIQLGYDEFGVYYLRASLHLGNFNYGLALQDINTVIEKTDDATILRSCQSIQVSMLLTQRKYKEALDMLLTTDKSGNDLESWATPDFHRLTEDILYKASITHMVGKPFDRNIDSLYRDAYKQVLCVLLAMLGKVQQIVVVGETEIPVPILDVEEYYPEISDAIREIVGEDIWEAVKTKTPIEIRIKC